MRRSGRCSCNPCRPRWESPSPPRRCRPYRWLRIQHRSSPVLNLRSPSTDRYWHLMRNLLRQSPSPCLQGIPNRSQLCPLLLRAPNCSRNRWSLLRRLIRPTASQRLARRPSESPWLLECCSGASHIRRQAGRRQLQLGRPLGRHLPSRSASSLSSVVPPHSPSLNWHNYCISCSVVPGGPRFGG